MLIRGVTSVRYCYDDVTGQRYRQLVGCDYRLGRGRRRCHILVSVMEELGVECQRCGRRHGSDEISYERSSNSINVSADIINSGDVRINGCKVKLLYRTQDGREGQAIVPSRSIGIEPGEEETYTYVDSGNGDPANNFIVETWTACNTRKIHIGARSLVRWLGCRGAVDVGELRGL